MIDDSFEATKLTKISEKVLISNVLLPNVWFRFTLGIQSTAWKNPVARSEINPLS